jgi:hypothetical protein
MRFCRIFVSALLLICISFAALAQEETPVAELVSEGWKHKVWLSYPPEKFRAGDVPRTEGKAEAVRLSAARGEVEPFLLVLRPEVPLRGVEAKLSELVGPGGAVIPASVAPAQHLGYVFVDEPSGNAYGSKDAFLYRHGPLSGPVVVGACRGAPAA